LGRPRPSRGAPTGSCALPKRCHTSPLRRRHRSDLEDDPRHRVRGPIGIRARFAEKCVAGCDTLLTVPEDRFEPKRRSGSRAGQGDGTGSGAALRPGDQLLAVGVHRAGLNNIHLGPPSPTYMVHFQESWRDSSTKIGSQTLLQTRLLQSALISRQRPSRS